MSLFLFQEDRFSSHLSTHSVPHRFCLWKPVSPTLFAIFLKPMYFISHCLLKETVYLPASSWIVSILCGPLSARQDSRSLFQCVWFLAELPGPDEGPSGYKWAQTVSGCMKGNSSPCPMHPMPPSANLALHLSTWHFQQVNDAPHFLWK